MGSYDEYKDILSATLGKSLISYMFVMPYTLYYCDKYYFRYVYMSKGTYDSENSEFRTYKTCEYVV